MSVTDATGTRRPAEEPADDELFTDVRRVPPPEKFQIDAGGSPPEFVDDSSSPATTAAAAAAALPDAAGTGGSSSSGGGGVAQEGKAAEAACWVCAGSGRCSKWLSGLELQKDESELALDALKVVLTSPLLSLFALN